MELVDGVVGDAGADVGEPGLRVDVVEPAGLDKRKSVWSIAINTRASHGIIAPPSAQPLQVPTVPLPKSAVADHRNGPVQPLPRARWALAAPGPPQTCYR